MRLPSTAMFVMLMAAGCAFAQSRDTVVQVSPSLAIRLIAPSTPRYPEGAPVVVHVGQKGKDVPARMSAFGFVDVVLPEGAASGDVAEVLRSVENRLKPAGVLVLPSETGVIAWSGGADTALEAISTPGRYIRWYVSEGGQASRERARTAVAASPKLAVIVWASEKDIRGYEQYEAFQSAGVRWIRLNAAAQYLGDITGRNAPHLPENPPNARFDRESFRSALALEPANGGNASSLGVTAAVLELADRTRRGDW